MGSRRECTRILGLEGFRVETITWDGEGLGLPMAIARRSTLDKVRKRVLGTPQTNHDRSALD